MDRKAELSTNALAALLVVAILVSVGGTFVSLSKLRADSISSITGAATSGTGTTTATVTNVTAITIHQSPVAFGSIGAGSKDDTTDGSPVPFQVNNTGNVPVNVTINASALFAAGSRNTSSYRFSCGADEGSNCPTGSATAVTDMPTANDTLLNRTAIYDLPVADGNDSREVEIYLSVPSDEPGGAKTSTVTFQAAQI